MVLNVLTLDGKDVIVGDKCVACIPAFRDIVANGVNRSQSNRKLPVPMTSDILLSLCTWLEYLNLAPSVEDLQNFYVKYHDHNIQQLDDLLSAARILRLQSFLDVYETTD